MFISELFDSLTKTDDLGEGAMTTMQPKGEKPFYPSMDAPKKKKNPAIGTLAFEKLPAWKQDELRKAYEKRSQKKVKESQQVKLPSGDYMNQHTGVKSSKPGQNLGEPSDADKKDYYQKELNRLKANPNSHKSHIRRAEQMVRRYSR